LHCLKKPEVLDDSMAAFHALTDADVREFGYQDAAFAKNPKSVLSTALNQVRSDARSKQEYQGVLLPLVYGEGKYSFEEALASFEEIGKRLIDEL
jgi:hypothetical protein